MPEGVVLPCPEGLTRTPISRHGIGNQRRTCRTCNRFTQAVMRETRKALEERVGPDIALQIKVAVTVRLYQATVERVRESAEIQATRELMENERTRSSR